MPETRPLFSVLKKVGDTCGLLQLESASDAGGTKIEFWKEIGEVHTGYAMAQAIVDQMNRAPKASRTAAGS